ncbi:histidine phosphatase family protein, partial [Clostridioides difficile]
MIRLILIRHALTNDNKKGRLSGHINSCISEEGKLQINKITRYLSNENIDKVYTTPSTRTKDTVEKISKLKLLEIEEKEALREISFGDFEGRTFE